MGSWLPSCELPCSTSGLRNAPFGAVMELFRSQSLYHCPSSAGQGREKYSERLVD